MKTLRMAVPASVLVLSLVAVPSFGQAPDDAHKTSFVAPADTPAQVTTVAAKPAERALTQEEMGDLYMARKEYKEAADTYKILATQNPHNAVYLNKLGIAFHQQSALALALKCYEKAMKADPTYADAANNIGTIWYQRQKFGRAVRAYQRAIKIRADMPVLYSNLGYAYFGEKKYEESLAAFRTALQKDPQFFERNGSRTGSLLQDRSVGDRGKFYYLLAKSFAQSGNYERCIVYLRKAKDEGYAALADMKKDPVFSAVLKDPQVIELLAPKPVDSADAGPSAQP